jgi:hypothetical protein
MPLQIRRGLQAEHQVLVDGAIPLAPGELLFTTDTGRLYIGDDGLTPTPGGVLINSEQTIDLSNYVGSIGLLEIEDPPAVKPFIIIGETTASIDLDGAISTNLTPNQDRVYSLGSESTRFERIWVGEEGVYIGDAAITASLSGYIELPAGSRVATSPIITEDSLISTLQGETLTVSIIADDDTLMVDPTEKLFTGGLVGSVLKDNNDTIIDYLTGNYTNGSLAINSNEIYTENQGPVTIYGGTSQTQVVFPSIAASTTDGSIISSGQDFKVVAITSYKNSIETPGDHVSGDVLGTIGFRAYQNTSDEEFSAYIGVQADPLGTTTSSHVPTKIFFANTQATESDPLPPLMTFDSKGQLAVNKETAQATLDVNGFAKLAILSAEPSNPADGMIAIADGTSWNPLSTIGKKQMVVYLGGWRQISIEP